MVTDSSVEKQLRCSRENVLSYFKWLTFLPSGGRTCHTTLDTRSPLVQRTYLAKYSTENVERFLLEKIVQTTPLLT